LTNEIKNNDIARPLQSPPAKRLRRYGGLWIRSEDYGERMRGRADEVV